MCSDCADQASEATAGLSAWTILLFACAAGLSVANIYLAQPLLATIADDFAISAADIGSVVTLTQIGYGAGLIALVPLGDIADRRLLITAQGSLSVVALTAVGTAGTEIVLFAGFFAMGFLAVAAQTIVAFASTLAASEKRGQVVGSVTSGIVVGILAARFVAGFVADLGGWRAVYLTSAALTAAMMACLWRNLPVDRREPMREPYQELLFSMPRRFLQDDVLRYRGSLALLIFATFSTFWTALTLPLSAPEFSYTHSQIGLFGLVGMAGALAASIAGRFADRGSGERTTGWSLAMLIASWALIACLPFSLVLLLIGIVVLDLAVQAVHVTSQSIIVARFPDQQSRLIGGYMVFYSIGSAGGALAATTVYAWMGWPGVCALGAAFSLSALLLWFVNQPGRRPVLRQ